MAIIDLIFRRVIFLFIVGMILSFLLIDHKILVVKALNTMLPATPDLKEFIYHPAQMPPEKIKGVLGYYKYLCDVMAANTYEKPAACAISGYAYYYLGDENNAIEYLTRSVKIFDHFFWAYYDLGVIYYNEGRYEKAIEYFTPAKEAYPYTVGFCMATRVYAHFAECLKLTKEGVQDSLDQAAEYMQKLFGVSRALVENPDLEKQFMRKKIDLRIL